MSEIIKKLKENQFITIKKSEYKCPICNGDLYTVDYWMDYVLDGNTVYQCENSDDHRYWHHPFENEIILHLNKHANETNYDTEQDYVLVDGSWIKKNK